MLRIGAAVIHVLLYYILSCRHQKRTISNIVEPRYPVQERGSTVWVRGYRKRVVVHAREVQCGVLPYRDASLR